MKNLESNQSNDPERKEKLTRFALGEIDAALIGETTEAELEEICVLQEMSRELEGYFEAESVPRAEQFPKVSSSQKILRFAPLAVAACVTLLAVLNLPRLMTYEEEFVQDDLIASSGREGKEIVDEQSVDLEAVLFEVEEKLFDYFEPSPNSQALHAALPRTSEMMTANVNHYRVRSAMREIGKVLRLPLDVVEHFNTSQYDSITERGFVSPTNEPFSTFSIDVDTAGYAQFRSSIEHSHLSQGFRIEELLNYFDYDYPRPESLDEPFSVSTELSKAPWAAEHQIMQIGIQGYEVPWEERPLNNLVFLLDVSGSMSAENKLSLVKKSLQTLVQRLGKQDRVAIVTYAGASGLALPSTTADNHETINFALDRLNAGGSTNGGRGIELAYATAEKHFIEGGNNRVILCTDGDFNVGVTSRVELVELIERKAESNIFLTICGFGVGNYHDGTMEELSNKGNGNYAYIDSPKEAERVFGNNITGTLLTIAKDVKIQVEFNPQVVAGYRLIGYENRALNAGEFNDDTKDAGEIGSGHSVTALYEIIPVGIESAKLPSVDSFKYQTTQSGGDVEEIGMVKVRYKEPDGDTSSLIRKPVLNQASEPSTDLQFASAVAELGHLLRGSEHIESLSWERVIRTAKTNLGEDPHGYRAEFVELARKAKALSE